MLGPNKYWFKKSHGSLNISAAKVMAQAEIFLGKNHFLVQNIFGSKNLTSQNLWSKNNFVSKIF